MQVAFVHTQVLEDLRIYGIDMDNYGMHVGYEHRMVRLFRLKGFEADLLIFSRSTKARFIKHVWGHRIIVVPVTGPRFVRLLTLASPLIKMVRNYDIVHCFSYYNNIYDVLAIACRLAKVPLVARAHSIYPKIPLLPSIRKMFTLRLASYLIPLNNSEAKFPRKKFRIDSSRISIVPDFIELQDYIRIPRLEARKMLGLDEDAYVVLTVCRLVPEKGVPTLLEAAAKVRDRVPKMSVVVVGEGPYGGVLESLAKNLGLDGVVRFEGFVPNWEVGKYYSAADLFVLASVEEGSPIVLLEAMLFGVPVVSSRSWGSLDTVIDGVTGILFEPGDAAELAKAILRFHEDPEAARIVGEQGRRRVLENYVPNKIYSALKHVYQKCLER